jgi:hypothetical protein
LFFTWVETVACTLYSILIRNFLICNSKNYFVSYKYLINGIYSHYLGQQDSGQLHLSIYLD